MVAVGVHIARIGLFTTDANGNRIDKNSNATTINQLKNTKQECLIIPDLVNAPNSAGYPAISEYLRFEAASGFVVEYLDQSYCITIPAAAPVAIDPISYTYTGTLTAAPIAVLSTPIPVQVGNSVTAYSGKWVSTFRLSSANLSLTAISFTDLQGISGSYSQPTLPALTSLSFPVLTTVGGVFSPSSMAALTSLSVPVLTTIGGSFQPSNMPALTSLNLPALTTVGSQFNPNNLNALTSLSAPVLKTIGSLRPNAMPLTSMSFPALTTADEVYLGPLASLTSLSLPALVATGSFGTTSMAVLTSLNLPALTTISGSFYPTGMAALTSMSAPVLTSVTGIFAPATMASLTSMNFPVLATIGSSFAPATMASLTSMSFPALTSVGGTFAPATMAALTSITIASMVRIGTSVSSGSAISIISGTAALNTFQLPSTLLQIGNGGGNVVITSAALNQASVDNILVRLAALNGTGGTTAFSNRVVTITGTSSTPSATGLAAKATLVARGCTVTNN